MFLHFLLFREKEEAEKDAESGVGASNEEAKSGHVRGRGDDDEDDVTDLYDLAHYDSDEDVEGNALSFLNKIFVFFMNKVNEYSGTCLLFSHLVITGTLICSSMVPMHFNAVPFFCLLDAANMLTCIFLYKFIL